MNLSDLALRAQGQPMFSVLERVQKLEREGKKIIHFELGEPDFDTPENIINSAKQALDEGNTHYTSSMGLHDLRLAVSKATSSSRGFAPSLDQILITPGANAIIYLSIACLTNPGDEVIVPDPGFPTYFSSIELCNAIAVSAKLSKKNNLELQAKDVEKRITPNTKLIIINSPSNPTGACMSKTELKKIEGLAKEHNIFVLSDEIYSRLNFGLEPFYSPSVADECKERTIILNGFSKAFAMTGWRLGVAIGPSEVIAKMNLILNTIVSCVPPFIQIAGIEAINGDQSALKKMKDEYSIRAKLLVQGLNSIKGVECLEPSGAMYVFPSIKGTGLTSDEFVEKALLEAGVALLPGHNFGSNGEGYVRMCYVNSTELINEAIENLKRVFN